MGSALRRGRRSGLGIGTGIGARFACAGVALGLLVAAGIARAGAPDAPISGTVTNSLTGAPVAGVGVAVTPASATPVVTGPDGTYVISPPAGSYTVQFTEDSYTTQSLPADTTGGAVVLDVSLVPRAPVLVNASLVGSPAPGAVVQAVGTIEILDGSTLSSVAWTQAPDGAALAIAAADQATTDVTLPNESSYKDHLIAILAEPPADPAANLPPGAAFPPDEFHGGLQNRYQVVAVNPLMAEEAGRSELVLTVVTSSGAYEATLDVHASLPWKVASGLRNVPIGRPVLVHAKNRLEGDEDPYDWTLIPPPSSGATLTDPTTQTAWFTPDVTGKYTLRVTDPETTDLIAIDVFAGTWVGAITGIDGGDGLPLSADCTSFCHSDTTRIAPDEFADWRQSGHAQAFTDLLDTRSYFPPTCFECHSVGYDPDVENGGLDDASDYPSFLESGLLGAPDPDNWATMVASFPSAARHANIQCENCHGPRSEPAAHGDALASRTLAATNCAQCHGEPARHGRYQQWQLSGHANYELATERSESSNCSRCHTANGFLAWLPILLDDDPNTDPVANLPTPLAWSREDAHPQTCATCHDPHDPGTQSGDPTNATVRIVGDTPPLIAGFEATEVGKGAMCMTCHNTRRGLRNDAVFPTLAASSLTQGPHPGAQADVIMGQNAYFVTVGDRGPHSNRDPSGKVADVCVDCHMEATPPPADLSYNQSGTNHTFYARPTICGTCHADGRTAEQTQGPIVAALDTLQTEIEAAIVETMDGEIQAGNSIELRASDSSVLAAITDVSQITSLEFGEGNEQVIVVSLDGGGSIGPVAMSRVVVVNGVGTSLGNLYQRSDPALPKGTWNYLLLEADGSKGVHNDEFATQVLDASIAAIQAVPEPGGAAAMAAAGAAVAALRRRARRAA